ncbi:MAG: T9SS type A sorting domain-containing protein [Bacteroidetes bacterium]|nr:T9SS type A sorting domain-containing protein [Bacteroidota bacterium]MBU1797654.1 T9SS type A sorting domain-containing protein [Bacteroidota bacterium]
MIGFVLSILTVLSAQNKDPHNLQKWNVFDINKLSTKFSNTNILACGTNQENIFPAYPPSMEYPAGSGINYGAAVSFVIGGRRQADAGGLNPDDEAYFDSGLEEGSAWIWDPHHFQSYQNFVTGDRTPMNDDPESWPDWPQYLPNYTYLNMDNLKYLIPAENNSLPQIPILLDSTNGWPGAGLNGETLADQESFSVTHTCNYIAEKNPGQTERWLNVQTITRGMAWKLPKYEDMIFWQMEVRNMGQSIEDCLIGIFSHYQFVADFEPFGGASTGGSSGEDVLYWDDSRQLVYGTDFDGFEYDLRGNTIPSYKIPWGGTVVLKTPRNMGVTRFDAYDGLKLFSTIDENGIWEDQLYHFNLLNEGDQDDPNNDGIDEGPYRDPWNDEWNSYKYGYPYSIMSAGPFNMEPGEIDTLIVATIFGQSKEDLLKNVDNAIALYKLNFKVPKPPIEPKVVAIAGDEVVTLTWGKDSESHPLFEGYRIYRSDDQGATWSKNYSTDENGTPISPIPVAQYDLKNEFIGTSSENPLFYFGDNTGFDEIIKIDENNDTTYEWKDNTVFNNYTYRYWVAAYSHGSDIEEPLETPPVNQPNIANDNTVEVIPSLSVATTSLNNITVVPNPYKVSAEWESEIGERKIAFSGLSGNCVIRIYNTAGELVKVINHNSGKSYAYWNLLNINNQEIAPGLYFYHVDAGNLGSKIGKFVIIL